MNQPTKFFHIVNNYLGWGDPLKGLWFVGIEEAQGWNESNIHKLEASEGKLFDAETEFKWLAGFDPQGAKIREYMSKICAPLSERYKDGDWKTFRDGKNLWAEGSKIFQTNLYPLGKPRVADWPENYKELFGFSREEIKSYHEYVRQTRFLKIREYRQHFSPQATVAFGTSFHQDFLLLFGLSESDLMGPEDKIYYSNEKRIILAPFFGQGMSNRRVEIIVRKLLEWEVKIP